MKSKNRLSKLIAFLVLLAVIAMIFVANTYSKYATNASGSDSVVVAKWSFEVNGEEIAVAGDAKTIAFNLFDTIYDSDGENEETDVADGVIAPGTSGEFEFALQNTSEVTAQYDIKLTVDNKNIPLEFSFDGETWTSDLTNLVAKNNLEIGASKNEKVMWRWAFGADTATDISLSEQTVNVSATINVIQLENIPEDLILVPNSEFGYGAWYDVTKNDATNKDKMTTGAYVLGKAQDELLVPQDITIKVTDTNVSNYCVTISNFDGEGNFLGRNGEQIIRMTNGVLSIEGNSIRGPYFRISVYIYSGGFTKIPETAEIVVYKGLEVPGGTTEEPEEPETPDTPDEPVTPDVPENTDENILIANDQFVYGSYYDITNNDANNKEKLTTGDYGKGKTSDVWFTPQDILVKVEDTDVSKYNVTLSWFDADGNYKGRSGILPMTNGELAIAASSMQGTYVRVSVYIYSPFTKIPETAKITVFRGSEIPERSWSGKTITVIGDSISTGGYPGMLGTMTGATIVNNSTSGIKLTTGIVPKVQELTGDSDLIIIFGGTNDYWHKGTSIGTIDSTSSSTYYGALNTILSTLKTNHSESEYLFVFPYDQTFQGNPSSTDFGYGTLDDFRAAFIEFCTQNDVNYVDLGETEFDCAQHTGDGVHPNTTGHQIIAEAIYDYISKY